MLIKNFIWRVCPREQLRVLRMCIPWMRLGCPLEFGNSVPLYKMCYSKSRTVNNGIAWSDLYEEGLLASTCAVVFLFQTYSIQADLYCVRHYYALKCWCMWKERNRQWLQRKDDKRSQYFICLTLRCQSAIPNYV